jgi:hypothetical protein
MTKVGVSVVRAEFGVVRHLSIAVGGQGRRGGRKWERRRGAPVWMRGKRVK